LNILKKKQKQERMHESESERAQARERGEGRRIEERISKERKKIRTQTAEKTQKMS